MKKDDFISIGLIVDENLKKQDILDIQCFLDKQYNFFEIILLKNDNAIDLKFDIHKITHEISNLRILSLSKSVDKENAKLILLENCIGDYFAIFSPASDTLSDLEQILIKAKGFDIVISKIKKDKRNTFTKISSKLFYKIISIFTGVKMSGNYGSLFVFNRKTINFIIKNVSQIKFLKLISFNNSFSKTQYEYQPISQNKHGNFFDNLNFTIDILTNYSFRLMRVATICSLFVSLINFFYVFYILGSWLLKDNIEKGWASSNLYNSFVYLVLFLVLAILGEYIRIILHNQKNHNSYEIVDEQSSIILKSDINVEKQ